MVCCTAHMEHCKECGKSFGSDEAKVCIKCSSFICPYCGRCSCYKTNSLPTWLLGLGGQDIGGAVI